MPFAVANKLVLVPTGNLPLDSFDTKSRDLGVDRHFARARKELGPCSLSQRASRVGHKLKNS